MRERETEREKHSEIDWLEKRMRESLGDKEIWEERLGATEGKGVSKWEKSKKRDSVIDSENVLQAETRIKMSERAREEKRRRERKMQPATEFRRKRECKRYHSTMVS